MRVTAYSIPATERTKWMAYALYKDVLVVYVYIVSVPDPNILTIVVCVYRWEAVHSAAAEFQDYQESEGKAEREWSSTSCTEVGPCMCTRIWEWESLLVCLAVCLLVCLSTCLSVYVCLSMFTSVFLCVFPIGSRLKTVRQRFRGWRNSWRREKRTSGNIMVSWDLVSTWGPTTQLLPSPLLVNLSALETLRMTVLWPVY